MSKYPAYFLIPNSLLFLTSPPAYSPQGEGIKGEILTINS